MALIGVHLVFGTALTSTSISTPLPAGLGMSQTMASPGTSSISAPSGSPLLSLSASAPIFYAFGSNPDPSGSSAARRYYDPATGREDVLVNAGDKVAWIFA